MPVYIVTYDLNSPGQNYQKLLSYIKGYGSNHCYLMKSSWLIYEPCKNAIDLFSVLMQYIDKNDSLFVSEVTRNSFGQIEVAAHKWLQSALQLP